MSTQTSDVISIPKKVHSAYEANSLGFKMSKAYWDLPSLDDNTVAGSFPPFVSLSNTEDEDYIYMKVSKEPSETVKVSVWEKIKRSVKFNSL